MRMLLAALAAAVVCLSGCAAPAKSTNTFERPMAFADVPQGVRVGDRIDWHLTLENGGDARRDALSLHVSVAFSNGAGADTAEVPVPAMGPGAKQAVVVSTPFRGYGDYSGPVEVWQGTVTLARDFMYFEDCGNC